MQRRRDLRVGFDRRLRLGRLRRTRNGGQHNADRYRTDCFAEMEHVLTVSVQKNPTVEERFPILRKSLVSGLSPLTEQRGRI